MRLLYLGVMPMDSVLTPVLGATRHGVDGPQRYGPAIAPTGIIMQGRQWEWQRKRLDSAHTISYITTCEQCLHEHDNLVHPASEALDVGRLHIQPVSPHGCHVPHRMKLPTHKDI